MPLFRTAASAVAADPDAFPIHGHVGIVVTSWEPLPDHRAEGYGEADAMIEVLVDAGLLNDERQVDWEKYEIRPGSTGYSISVEALDD
jgi:hypothetical protein